MDYIAYLHEDRKSDYGVSFPDFPGCITAGKTLEEARRMGVEALTFHIEGITEDGESIQQPSSLDQLAKDPAMKGAVAFLVNVNVTQKSERFPITARRSQMDEIDRRAKRSGMTSLLRRRWRTWIERRLECLELRDITYRLSNWLE